MIQKWRSASLWAHLLILFSVSLIVVLGASISFGTDAIRTSSREALEGRAVLAQLIATRVDRHFGSVTRALAAAVQSSGIEQAGIDLVSVPSLLESLLRDNANFRTVAVMDRGGAVLYHAPGTGEESPDYAGPRGTVRLAYGTVPVYLQIAEPEGSTPEIAVLYPIASPQGGVAGYLAAWLDLTNPEASLLNYPFELGDSGSTDIVDEKGRVLASTQPERVGVMSDHAGYLDQLLGDKDTAVGTCHSCHDTSGTNRQDEVAAFARLTTVPWSLTVRQPEAEVLAPTRALTTRLLASALLAAAVFAGLLWVTMRNVARPLRILSETCHRIASGNMADPITVTGVAEVNTLAHSLEGMRQDLVHYRQEVAERQHDLEQRVQERTAELRDSRDHLVQTNRDLATLNTVAAVLSESLDLHKGLSTALRGTLVAMQASSGGILLRESDDSFTLAVEHGLPPGSEGKAVGLQCAVPAGAQEDSWAAHLDNHCAGYLSEWLGYTAVLCVPLISPDGILGVLFVGDSKERTFRAGEKALLLSIGREMAVSVRNLRLYADLQREKQARGQMLQQVIAAQEDERQRIARELHDEISQALTALVVGIDTIGLAMPGDRGRSVTRLGTLKNIATSMLDGVHRLVTDLRPSLLDDLGLVPAISWYGEQRLQPAGIAFHLDSDGLSRLPTTIETTLFRITQEAITNVVRHAHATEVQVRLAAVAGHVVLDIQDDGVGFDPAVLQTRDEKGRGLGLQGMQERARILGGECTVQTGSGRGTTISVTIPLSTLSEKERNNDKRQDAGPDR